LKSTNKPLVVKASFKSIEPELHARKFILIHKSYIVSEESIRAVRENSIFIKDLKLTIGETYRDVVDNLVGNSS